MGIKFCHHDFGGSNTGLVLVDLGVAADTVVATFLELSPRSERN